MVIVVINAIGLCKMGPQSQAKREQSVSESQKNLYFRNVSCIICSSTLAIILNLLVNFQLKDQSCRKQF